VKKVWLKQQTAEQEPEPAGECKAYAASRTAGAGGFIVGFDSDTPSIFQRQIEFIQRSGIVTAMVGLLNAPPGTRLYERMREEGRLIAQCLETT